VEIRTNDEQMLETMDRDSRAAPLARPLAGSRFGRYTILEEIGHGAMATVYTAYDDLLDRKIAIKLIRDRDTRVRHEAQAIARVSHPNVLQIYETGTFEGHDFIAMELVDGVTLTTWQRIRSRNVYDLIAQSAEAGRGLAAAHRAGVVHRDFKPEPWSLSRTAPLPPTGRILKNRGDL
jgi:serine/threonine protein kinase